MREPSVIFISTEQHGCCVVVNLPNRNDTQIIWFDQQRGYPSFSGVIGYDLFESQAEALDWLQKNYIMKSKYNGYMIGGIFSIGNVTQVLIVTNVASAGKLLGKHDVLMVNKSIMLSVNTVVPNANEMRTISQIHSMGLTNNCFLCHTYDLSCPFSMDHDSNNVWNMYMQKPFDFMNLGKICPDLILGSFSTLKYGEYNLYYITRIDSEGCGPVSVTRGLFQNGSLGNFAIVEFLISYRCDVGIRVFSYIISRGTTPIGFSPGKRGPSEMPYTNLPTFILSLKSRFRFDETYLYDLGHSGCEFDNGIDNALKQSISFLGNGFPLRLIQFDYDCNRNEKGVSKTIDKLFIYIQESLASFDPTSLFVFNDKIKVLSRQKKCLLMTSLNGADRNNIGVCLSSINVFIKLCILSGIISNSTKNTSQFGFLPQEVRKFLLDSSINHGNIISILSTGTHSLSINDMSSFSKEFTLEKLHVQENLHNRKQRSLEDALRYRNYQFLRGSVNKITSSFPGVGSLIRCVSDFPGAKVLNNQYLNQLISRSFNIINVNIADMPIVIQLSEPSLITEISILIGPYSEKLSYPSCLNIYGGAYLNLLFPILEGCALPINDTQEIIRHQVPIEQLYNFSHSLNRYSPVRFLVFEFLNPNRVFSIGNIRVYGTTLKEEKIVITNLVQNNPVSEFYGNYSIENTLLWEENRLRNRMSLDEYFHYITTLEMNPGDFIIEKAMEPKSSLIDNSSQKLLCTSCQNLATFQCGMCRKYFCSKCNGSRLSPDVASDPKATTRLCDLCQVRKFSLLTSIAHLKSINLTLSVYSYPFINNISGSFKIGTLCSSFCKQTLPFTLISQVPVGKNNVIAESIFSESLNDYIPKENYILFDVSFHQESIIEEIEVVASEMFDILIPEAELSERVYPPGCIIPFNKQCRTLSFAAVGLISIRNISFKGRPVQFLTAQYPQISSYEPETRVYQTKAKHDLKQKNSVVQFPLQMKVCGLYFTEFKGVDAIFITIFSGKESAYHRIVMPSNCTTSFRLMFPSVYPCETLTVWYTETNDSFSMPVINNVIISTK